MHEYVEQAIACEIDVFGFSDHAPMDFDPKYRMQFHELTPYLESVKALKTQYASRIEILLGLEVDYLPGHMDKRVLLAPVDYLIGSVHFIHEWGFDNPEFIGRYQTQDINAIWSDYFKAVTDMAQSELFDIVGHVDLIKVFNFLPHTSALAFAKPALHAIKEAQMTLELNVAGYRKPIGQAYPSAELLSYAYALDIPITFGSDAHNPAQVGLYRKEIEALAKDIGYTQCALYRNRKREMVNF